MITTAVRRICLLGFFLSSLAFSVLQAATRDVTAYGATGNGTADDTTGINNAIAALVPGDTLLFPCGTYLSTSQLTITVSNVTVDGSGCAIIHNASSGRAAIMLIGASGNAFPNFGPAVPLSSTANELATSFTTVSSVGVSAGDYVYIHQGGLDYSTDTSPGHPTNCDVSGCRGEVLKVQSVNGNAITVATALHDTYDPSVNAAVAQKILNPLTGVTVKNITFEGTQALFYGFGMSGVAESQVQGVTARNVQAAALFSVGSFNLSYSNITVSQAGSTLCGNAVTLFIAGNMTVNGMSISNENPGTGSGCLANGAFGLGLGTLANGTFTNVTVDGSGAYGRPFKTTAARWNTFNSLTVKNGVAAMDGLAIHYYSSHNTYNNCVATNNGVGTGTGTGSAGIITFGNFNQYNTFSNCTVTGNGNIQFYVSAYDALRLGQDTYVTINGGTFAGTNSVEPVIGVEGVNPTVIGATVSGPGSEGISISYNTANACINNNIFVAGSGLGAAILSNSTTNIGSGNTLNGFASNLTAGSCSGP